MYQLCTFTFNTSTHMQLHTQLTKELRTHTHTCTHKDNKFTQKYNLMYYKRLNRLELELNLSEWKY